MLAAEAEAGRAGDDQAGLERGCGLQIPRMLPPGELGVPAFEELEVLAGVAGEVCREAEAGAELFGGLARHGRVDLIEDGTGGVGEDETHLPHGLLGARGPQLRVEPAHGVPRLQPEQLLEAELLYPVGDERVVGQEHRGVAPQERKRAHVEVVRVAVRDYDEVRSGHAVPVHRALGPRGDRPALERIEQHGIDEEDCLARLHEQRRVTDQRAAHTGTLRPRRTDAKTRRCRAAPSGHGRDRYGPRPR